MNLPAFRKPAIVSAVAGAVAVTVLSLSAGGLFGGSWDVRMEVTGPGTADVVYSFSGDSQGTELTGRNLPWSKAQNVGFGFNDLGVKNATPGTGCRIYVDGELKDERTKPDAKGLLTCSVNLQQD
ncbi:MmpS family transport accessory protein [Streptomyces sp. BBFR2]|uniref:MmpS family transport accessory protein n=1 Tax=Streptomyces sp. BBFR2 TaxID=3372854 RepID=UPI0037DA06C8